LSSPPGSYKQRSRGPRPISNRYVFLAFPSSYLNSRSIRIDSGGQQRSHHAQGARDQERPVPSQMRREVTDDDGGEGATQVSQRVHHGGHRSAVIAADIQRNRPRNGDRQLQTGERDGKAE